MTRKRKKGKLLVQVGLVVTAIFIAIIATQTYVTFQSTVHGYLEAQNRYIVNTLPLIIGTKHIMPITIRTDRRSKA